VDLEQREGRVNRYEACHPKIVAKNCAAVVFKIRQADPGEAMFAAAKPPASKSDPRYLPEK